MPEGTLGDVYEVIPEQALYSQVCLDTYFYRFSNEIATTSPTVAQVLAENWAAQILPDIVKPQAADVSYTKLRVRNLYNEADAFEMPLSISGDNGILTDQTMPAFNAFPFVLNGDTHVTKPGSKRLAGVPEQSANDGVIVDAGTLTRLGTAASAMERPVQVGLIIPSDVFYPIIVKRVRSGVSGAYIYRLPENQTEGLYSVIINALFKILVSSQVSRKVGVGI